MIIKCFPWNNSNKHFSIRDVVKLLLVLSQCKTTSAYEEPRSSGNKYTNSLVVKITTHYSSPCYIVNWRINKLFLPHTLYSGAIHISLFSQRPFHFHCCIQLTSNAILSIWERDTVPPSSTHRTLTRSQSTFSIRFSSSLNTRLTLKTNHVPKTEVISLHFWNQINFHHLYSGTWCIFIQLRTLLLANNEAKFI